MTRELLIATLGALTFGVSGCSFIVNFDGPAPCTKRSECEGEGDYCIYGTCQALAPTDAQCKGMRLGKAFEDDALIVPVGAVMPLSGINGPRGEATIDGAELAMRQINQARGLQEGRLGIITCDTEYIPERAVASGEWLTQEVGVPAIIGALSSSETLAVANDVTFESETVLISPSSTSPAISGLNDSDLVWRTIASDANQAPAMIQLARAATTAPEPKFAVIVVNSAYGTGFLQEITNTWIGLDPDLINSDRFVTLRYEQPSDGKVSATDVSAIGEALFSGASALNPDVILMVGSTEGQELLYSLEQDHVDGAQPQWVLSEALQSDGLLDTKFQAYWDRIQGTTFLQAETATYQTFRQNYSGEFGGREAKDFPFSDKAFDAAYVIALAIASSSDPLTAKGSELALQIRKMSGGSGKYVLNTNEFNSAATALNQGQIIDIEGASGGLDFDSRGDVSSDVARWSITNGSYNEAEPLTPDDSE